MGRSPCCDKNGLKKGPWTTEEDQKLVDYIRKNGSGNWRTLPKNAGLERCGKSCRLRWTNYLRPDIKRGRFTLEEEEAIIQLHSVLGNKWSTIAARLPGRTDNEIKNYWNTHIRKRLLRMGIDPVTHNPRLDLLDLSSHLLTPSLYNSSQMNISRLLGVHTLVNPELLSLATSLFSSSQQCNQTFLPQNVQENNLEYSTDHDQFMPPLMQPNQDEEFQNCSHVPLYNDAQLIDPQFSNQLHNWQCNEMDSINTYVDLQNYSYYDGSDQSFNMDNLPSDNSDFRSNGSNNMISLTNLSTPVSSPTHINSTSTTIAQDERENYYSISSMMKFEFPNNLDINCFM